MVARLRTTCDHARMTDAAAPAPLPTSAAFLAGIRAGLTSVFVLVLFGTYVGLGALAHDLGFPIGWTILATLLIWAGPAQVILTSALGSGATMVEAGLAVGLSSVRLLPMVVSLLPLLRGPATRTRDLILPAHFTAVSMWIEAQRLLPHVARENRVAYANGIGVGLNVPTACAAILGFYLASGLPAVLAAALLMLTPLSFLVSLVRNSRARIDRLALFFGLALAPVFAFFKFELDLMWTGLAAGTLAYAGNRMMEQRNTRAGR
jgi:predicted branched-subunit amino acid permease